MKVFYLGPPKTFSERAAAALSDGRELVPEANFQRVAQQAASHPAAFGVLPYYNFLDGLIQETLDLIYEYGLTIQNAYRLPIELSIGGYGDAVIHSHPKALAQCSDFLRDHFPNAVLQATASTADAARLVKESGHGVAIASREAFIEHGLREQAVDIGNRRHGRQNFTDFLLVSPESSSPAAPPAALFRTLIAITPRMDRVGLLAEILEQFRFHDLNIAKIHSRPAIDPIEMNIEPQMFYTEVMSGVDGKDLRRCADALNYRYGERSVRVLGSFPALGEA